VALLGARAYGRARRDANLAQRPVRHKARGTTVSRLR
jgi:hypothetical protein